MVDFLRLLIKMQRIDRRVLYLLLALIIALPMIITIPTPNPAILPETRKFYETIEEMAADPARKDKLVILCTNYGSGTSAENQTQAEAVAKHLAKKGLKFAVFTFNTPQGRELGQAAAEAAEKKFNLTYGKDWVNWGYRPGDAIVPMLKSAVRDVPGSFGKDVKGTALADVPLMKGITTVNDIGLIIEVASANTVPVWLQYYQRTGDQPIPTLYCPTSVMAPEAFPLLKSGQLSGMLFGLKGANEYEILIGERAFGQRGAASLAYAHLLIIVLVILGNVGMFAQKRLTRMIEEGEV